MRDARLRVSDKPVWPEIGYVNFKSVIARMQVSIDARRIRMLPERSERCAVDTNASHFIDFAQIEPKFAIGNKLICVDVNAWFDMSQCRRNSGSLDRKILSTISASAHRHAPERPNSAESRGSSPY